ncbi:MAG TPA: alpha-galactosidase [Candidatus Methylacidiphilales bacterium]|nr:alpha-galactosidase [Candidatus Methylacidiphilales bacterium]
MKPLFFLVLLSGFPILSAMAANELVSPQSNPIRISTANSEIVLVTGSDGRLYQLGYGKKGANFDSVTKLVRTGEFYPPYGNGYLYEPAVQAIHADGNTSTDLTYVKTETFPVDADTTYYRIELKDSFYPFFVSLCFKAYHKEDLIEAWTEIHHAENAPVTLFRFASSSPVIPRGNAYWMTQFIGDYAHEANLSEEKLTPGLKILDSKLGVRADYYRNPSFILALGKQAQEDSGEVYGGTLAWSGSFQFAFDMDTLGHLRVLAGINPFGSQYRLVPGKIFITPSMLWTWSDQGKGQVSRNFHHWAAHYGMRDGDKLRPVLLNNWEATGFDFNEERIVSLFDGAKELGAETFLLDDGWFGNKYPRDDDHAGLGDWRVNQKKLPRGISYLAAEAQKRGLKFGIWMEPEMVNPKSELYELHPDWIITQPHRALEFFRNQLVLDLSRPKVKDFVWKSIDNLLGENPGVSYMKWDCNRYVEQPGSAWLPPDEQSNLLIDYNLALYHVMDSVSKKYPQVMVMVCSGGSGRADYGSLRYFDSFWPSDDTDPEKRVYIQWGFSHIFPASAICAHVTRSGNRPLKFTIDVALSGTLGIDIDVGKLSAGERKTLAAGIALYKQSLRDLVQQGDLYRLESPYDGPRSALSYVRPDQSQAVLFVYQLKDASDDAPVKLKGLDPEKQYHVHEVNLPEGAVSGLAEDGKTVSGTDLMQKGLVPPCHKECDSAVIQLD